MGRGGRGGRAPSLFFEITCFLQPLRRTTNYPVDIGRKLNVHKTFRRRPGRLLNVLCTFNLRLCLRGKLFEAELIINSAPLIYVYPNTIKTCLTSNYLLFGRQLLLSSDTTSTVAANLAVLSSTADKINRISNHFGIGGGMNM